MGYSQKLRALFPDISLHWEDLLLLESFQVKNLPERVAAKEFAILLHTYPVAYSFLILKHPPIKTFLDQILQEYRAENDVVIIENHCQEALWEIAELIIYNKYPELFDSKAPIRWEIEEILEITSLQGKIVADVGAGSGRIAFLVAPMSHTVYAVEPVGSLRTFMKEKARKMDMDKLFVMDGTLDSIPLPHKSLDVLITSNAIGWNLDKELKEIERVVKPGGFAIHLFYSDLQQEDPFKHILSQAPWKYLSTRKEEEGTVKIRYYKLIPSS